MIIRIRPIPLRLIAKTTVRCSVLEKNMVWRFARKTWYGANAVFGADSTHERADR